MAKDNSVNSGVNHNMIASGTKIVGTITTDSDIRIDGEVDGDVICQSKVILGTSGFVKGILTCTSGEIMGRVEGSIISSELLSMKATANLQGDIKTKVLSIEPGAVFIGTCKMGE